MPRSVPSLPTRLDLLASGRLSRRAFLAASLAQAAVWIAACTPASRAPSAPTGNVPSRATLEPVLTTEPLTVPLVPAPASAPAGAATGTLVAGAATRGATCSLAPAVAPTALPYPGYTAEEPATGLHVTGPAQAVDLASYRLRVYGKVDHPLELTYDEVRCLPKVSVPVMLECPGFFVDNTNLAGATIASVLALASPQRDAMRARVLSVENYGMPFAIEEALDPKNFLAYEWEGQPLPASHGFPMRAAMPGRPGSSWVKWVVSIEIS